MEKVSNSTRRYWSAAALAKFVVGLAVSVCASQVLAQTPTSQTANASEAETEITEVIVTGSRIAAPNEQSTSPIQVISAQSIATTGKTDISDIITQLPQNFNNGLGQDLGNGTSGLSTPGGVATADLRGLGPNRTLVLVDGRRLGQGTPQTFIQSPAPDLDQIPSGLIDRVEVVTGGASAAYGSDAIAGVINFIMKRNFEGLRIDGQFNENWHDNHDSFMQNAVTNFGGTPATGTVWDGRQRSFDLTMGTNFAENKGNITAFLSYRHADPVNSTDRDFGGCSLDKVLDADKNLVGLRCGGSSNSNFFEPLTGPNANSAYSVHGTDFIPRGTGVATTPPASFNSQPYIDMTREDDRYNAAILAHEDLFDAFRPYGEFYFMDDRTHTNIAPSALFRGGNPLDPFGTNGYVVNCDNPLLSGQEASILCSSAQLAYVAAHPGQPCAFNTNAATGAVTSPNCADLDIGRRNIEGGGRSSDYEHENYRAVFGATGEFADGWTYDAYGQYYYTRYSNSQSNYLGFQSIANALQVTGTAANPVCIGQPAGCVPYNIFSDGAVTQAQLQYLYLLGTAQGSSTLRTLHAEVTGQLGKYGITSPWAGEGVGVNLGYEHRNDHEFYQPDAAEQSGLLSGFGTASVPIDNGVAVSEEFAEVRVPILQKMPFAHELLFDTGFRRSDYSNSGVTNTYKFEVQFAPIEDYRIRASYDKAIRAPTTIELFNPQVVGTTQLGDDPCAPTFTSNGALAAPAAYSFAQCQHMGVTAAQYGNGGTTDIIPQGTGGQLSQLTGGNPKLKPEQAETYTVGVNFRPSQIPNLSGSLDYYHIAIKDEVGTVPGGLIFSQCGNTGNPFYCGLIFRNPVTGGLNSSGTVAQGGYLVQTNINVGAALASGIDAQLSYNHDLPLGLGNIGFELNGVYVQHFDNTPTPGAHTYDCSGLFGFTCQTVNPHWHHLFRTTWTTPWNVSAALTWRFIGPVSEDSNSADPSLHFSNSAYSYDFVNGHIPGYNYFDLEATWHVAKFASIRAGVNNVLDKDPPLINQYAIPGGAANTIDAYDMFGRQVFVAFTVQL